MSHRSRKHKKRFACGHRGFGQYCHRCANHQVRKRAKTDLKKSQKAQWEATFANDEIDLSGLPTHIIGKTRRVLAELSQGTHYWEVSGKRLQMMREVCGFRLLADTAYFVTMMARHSNRSKFYLMRNTTPYFATPSGSWPSYFRGISQNAETLVTSSDLANPPYSKGLKVFFKALIENDLQTFAVFWLSPENGGVEYACGKGSRTWPPKLLRKLN